MTHVLIVVAIILITLVIFFMIQNYRIMKKGPKNVGHLVCIENNEGDHLCYIEFDSEDSMNETFNLDTISLTVEYSRRNQVL